MLPRYTVATAFSPSTEKTWVHTWLRSERHSTRRNLLTRVHDDCEFFVRRLMAFHTEYSARRTHGRMCLGHPGQATLR